VHRLDKDVSGIVLAAKDSTSAAWLSQLFREGQIRKTYFALVQGRVQPEEGVINLSLVQDKSGIKIMKTAETSFRTLQRGKECSLLMFHPRTGRKHQIRKHASSMGHPIMNDPVYGTGSDTSQRIWLHAIQLTFNHQITEQSLTLSAPLPRDMKQAIRHLIFGRADLPARHNQ